MLSAALAKKQTYVLQVYGALAFLSLAVFAVLHIFVDNTPLTGYCELGGAAAVAASIFLVRVTGNITASRAALLLTMLVMLFVMLVTGGTQGTGIFWFFMFPVAAFFLAGAREGASWMLLLVAVLVVSWIVGEAGLIPFYYRDIEVRQLAVTMVVITIGLFIYQRYLEHSNEEAVGSRERLEANLHQEAALRVQMDRAKGEFVALASHQLRTPISAIRWSAEMLLGGDTGKLTDEQRDTIEGIEQSNNRLGSIVDAMLLVSSLDLGKLEVQLEPTDLPELSRKVLRERLKKEPDKHLETEESYQEDLPKLRLDAHVMTIILQNLFSNAVKYTPDGGKISVSIKVTSEKLFKGSRGSVLLEIADSGYGIPLDQQAGVFNKMFRATNIKAKDTDGTGLGLYTVKAILAHVGGRIWFESEEDKGSVFFVQLPLEGMDGLGRV
jgi:signal transduction histidine kinase